jgi:hypothetical protein
VDYEYNKTTREILMAYVRESSVGDPALLAPNLREADLDELKAASARSPQDVLYLGHLLGKPCRTFIGNTGNIVGMYGVTPMPSEYCNSEKQGVVWCLTTPELFKIKKFFVRTSKRELLDVCQGYDRVFNFVYHKNTRHIRWIKAMGFTMEKEPRPFGWQDRPFYYFEKVINNV